MESKLSEKQQSNKKDTEELTFKCKLCGKVKPLSQLREVRRFFPVIAACSECDDKMYCGGRRS